MKFINLSNHSIEKWDKEQKGAAGLLSGQVEGVDIPFPNVSAGASASQLSGLATETYRKIIAVGSPFSGGDDSTVWAVHIMGELTLTYALVGALREAGYNCLASTTERVVVEKDGVKTSTFKFCQFRTYEVEIDTSTEAERAEDTRRRNAWAAQIEDTRHRPDL